MAKGSSGRGSAHGTPSSLTSLLALSQPAMPVALAEPVIVRQLYHGNYDEPLGDRRRYQPDRKSAPPHAARRYAVRLHSVVAAPQRQLSPRVKFAVPNLVTICLRRKLRREVLHALNRTRQGSGSKRRRNFWSNVKC